MRTLFIKPVAIILACTSLIACNSTEQTEEVPGVDSVSAATAEQPAEDEDSVTVVLPSPLQIASIFKKSGLTYLDGVANDIANIDKYSSLNKKAMNLGVYSADLAYCVLNKQTQKAMDYMKTVKTLGTQMGMSSVFENNTLVDRFQKNLNNEDSLAYVIADLQMETDMYLEQNDLMRLSPVMFTGAWVEAVYLGAKVHEMKKTTNVSHKIVEQMIILEKILAVLKKHETDPEVKELSTSLTTVNNWYMNLPAVKSALENQEETQIKLSDAELKELTGKIVELRNKIVNG